MRVALLNPPSPFLIDQKVFSNTGIVRVATHLNQDHDVRIFDFADDDNYIENARSLANDFDAFIFSSTTPQFPYTYQMFKQIKEVNPKARTVLGGAHASAISSIRQKGMTDINIDVLNEFDTIFSGEGEQTERMFQKGWVQADLIKNIDDVLIPDRSIPELDITSYHYKLNGKETTNIQTQRGCPLKCAFCCGREIDMYRIARAHSPKRVLKELDKLNDEFGYESFMWYDDEVNISHKRLESLAKELSKRNYQHRGFVVSDLIVRFPDTVKMLKDAGFVKLCTGVESGSDRILKNIFKRTDYEMNIKARQLIKEQGIHYEAFLMYGHPDERMSDINLTKKWLKEAQPDDFDINIMTPYPGSIIYDQAVKSKEFEGYSWEYNGVYFNKPDYSIDSIYYKGVDGKSASNVRTRELTYEQLSEQRDLTHA